MSRRILVTGATGMVGRFIVEALLGAGHMVTVWGRQAPPTGIFSRPVGFVCGTLDPERDQQHALAGHDALVHAAFDHVPGRYRGGEGEDREGFVRRNLEGSVALFEQAAAAGVGTVLFVSSRAVYGPAAAGQILAEETAPRPDTLYGIVKREAEKRLLGLSAGGSLKAATVLRVTGVYGPPPVGQPHKWAALFDDYLAGRPVEPRAGTEVHGRDVAAAALLALQAAEQKGGGLILNVSDIIVDRHDLLAIVREATGALHPLPDRAAHDRLGVMATDRLRALGWQPGGRPLLISAVRDLLGRR
jgi:nucleoside-diphosphate-sugar epimerase